MTCKSCRGKPKTYRCWFCDDANLAAQNTPHPAGWPLVSEALAVHPDQVAEAVAEARKRGVPTEYTADGNPVFTDRGHRAAFGRAFGVVDRAGGYGDHTGHSRVSEMRAEAKQKYEEDLRTRFGSL